MSNPPEAPPDEQELALRLARAGEHLRADRLDEAASEIDAVLALLPHDVRARNMQGLLHFRAGRFPEARVIYSELLGEFGEDASLRLNLGLVELRMGNYQGAVHHLGWVAEAEPDNARAQGYYGLALLRSGEASKARVVLARAGQDELVRQLDRSLGGDGDAATAIAATPLSAPPQARLAPANELGRAPAAAAPKAAEPSRPTAKRAGRVATPQVDRAAGDEVPPSRPPAARPSDSPRPSPPSVTDARLAVAAGARALDDEQPFAAPEETAAGGTGGEAWQVRQAAQGLPAPVTTPVGGQVSGGAAAPSSQSPLRPIPLPERRSQPPGAPAQAPGPTTTASATPLGKFLRDRELGPPEGEAAFGLTPEGLLVVRIDARLPMRSVGVVVSTGELTFEPLQRRARGRVLAESFGDGPAGLFRATGHGLMVISPRGGHFVALALAEEAIYLRESATFAFEEALHWENGRIPGSGPAPGSGHPGLPDELSRVVQFRGSGQVVVHSERPLMTVRLPGGQTSFIEVEQLVGWTGRIIPSLLIDDGGTPTPYVECSGEGFLLIEPPPREGNPAPPTPPALDEAGGALPT